jgi:hypothetical protein
MRVDFLEWYNAAYPREKFDNTRDRLEHQLISYNGWLAAMKTYGVKISD